MTMFGFRVTGAPLDADDQALGEIADWGPPEDWSDWAVDPSSR